MKFWIKAWIETLHDPKMACLSDRLWRRGWECFLMAGEHDKDGFLPPLKEMAWVLRMESEILESDLVELQIIKILNFVDGHWFVVNFAERQRPSNSAERSKQHRKRKKIDHYQGKLWDKDKTLAVRSQKRGEDIRGTEEIRREEISSPFSDELVKCPKCTAMVSEQHLDLECLNHVTTKEERQARHDYIEAQRVAVALETKPAGIDGNPDEESEKERR